MPAPRPRSRPGSVPGSLPSRRRAARPIPRRRRGLPWGSLLLAALGGTLLWLSRGWWWPAPPQPQMILVLGGDVAREQAAAELARQRVAPNFKLSAARAAAWVDANYAIGG